MKTTFSLFKKIANTVFPRIIAGGDYSREVDYSREANIAIPILLNGSCTRL